MAIVNTKNKKSNSNSSQLSFQSLFESCPGLILILASDSPHFTIVAANNDYLLSTMTKREEILGRGIFDVFPDNPKDPKAMGSANVLASLTRVLKSKAPDTVAVIKYDILRLESSGGGYEERYWSPTHSPVFDSSGEITHIIHQVKDITELMQLNSQVKWEQQKAAKSLQVHTEQMNTEIYLRNRQLQETNVQLFESGEKLRQSAERLQSILDTAYYAFFAMDAKGLITDWNHQAEVVFGWSKSEVIGRTLAETIVPIQFREAYIQGLKRFLTTGEDPALGKRLELSALNKSGLEFPAEFTINALKQNDGFVFFAFLQNITERKKITEDLRRLNEELEARVAERTLELQKSEKQLMLITDTLPVAVTYIDVEQRFRFVNATYAKWRRLPKEKIIGKCIKDFLDEKTYQDALPTIEKMLSGQTVSSELTIPYPDKTRLVSTISQPDFDHRGKFIGSISVTADITGQKEAENSLRDAKIAAENANQTKSYFLANMSHEIRTPLGVILGFSELLGNPESTSSEKLNFIGAIKRNGELLANIINDILDLSKVEAGKLKTESLETAISEIITDISSFLRLKAVEKGIELSISYEKTVPKIIRTDPLRLKQILMNIVGNAIKFTECGSVDVTLKFLQKNDESGNLVFVVKDTGRGISKEEKKKLFQPFSQADVTTKRKFGGTGLGLVLSKHLAVLLGGDVVLTESTPQKGSTFTITIDSGPILKSSISEMGEERKILLSSNDGSEVRLDGIRVLVVDDSADNQILVSKFLKMAGAQVNTAENGEVALEKIRQEKFDIVLMDLQMPIKDGYETTAELRRDGYKTPIFALTAHALKEEREHCLSSGFDNHISKPINRNTLIDSIAKFCSRSK